MMAEMERPYTYFFFIMGYVYAGIKRKDETNLDNLVCNEAILRDLGGC